MQDESRASRPRLGRSGLRLRRPGVGDLNTLVALEAASFDDPWPRSVLASELPRDDAVLLLAEIADSGQPGSEDGPPARAAGYAAYRAAAGEAELLRLAVSPAWRRRGVAGYLLTAGDRALAEASAEVCYLEVRASNRGALAFYRRAGFHRIGRRPAYYPNGDDALLLARAVRGDESSRRRPG